MIESLIIGPGGWSNGRRRVSPGYPELRGRGDSVSQFVATYDTSLVELSSLWNNITLEDDEKRVIDALNVIEPDISRIAYLPGF